MLNKLIIIITIIGIELRHATLYVRKLINRGGANLSKTLGAGGRGGRESVERFKNNACREGDETLVPSATLLR